jgi:hypothetical protein
MGVEVYRNAIPILVRKGSLSQRLGAGDVASLLYRTGKGIPVRGEWLTIRAADSDCWFILFSYDRYSSFTGWTST